MRFTDYSNLEKIVDFYTTIEVMGKFIEILENNSKCFSENALIHKYIPILKNAKKEMDTLKAARDLSQLEPKHVTDEVKKQVQLMEEQNKKDREVVINQKTIRLQNNSETCTDTEKVKKSTETLNANLLKRGIVKIESKSATCAMDKYANLPNLDIKEIAQIIKDDWKNVHYSALPYLEAMFALKSIKDSYYQDSGEEIVARFLCNANSYKGEIARAVKKELNKRLKGK